jgi:hypothetical protein
MTQCQQKRRSIFGLLLYKTRVLPVTFENHGRTVIMFVSIKGYTGLPKSNFTWKKYLLGDDEFNAYAIRPRYRFL